MNYYELQKHEGEYHGVACQRSGYTCGMWFTDTDLNICWNAIHKENHPL